MAQLHPRSSLYAEEKIVEKKILPWCTREREGRKREKVSFARSQPISEKKREGVEDPKIERGKDSNCMIMGHDGRRRKKEEFEMKTRPALSQGGRREKSFARKTSPA